MGDVGYPVALGGWRWEHNRHSGGAFISKDPTKWTVQPLLAHVMLLRALLQQISMSVLKYRLPVWSC